MQIKSACLCPIDQITKSLDQQSWEKQHVALKAAQWDYLTMLTVFPKLHLRIYEHALLVHVPKILLREPLITGSSFFLGAFNKVWKEYLLFHANNGGGETTAGPEEDQEQSLSKSSEAGEHRRKANRHSKTDYQPLGSLWALSDPRALLRWLNAGQHLLS
jgi:hypothetical protein